MIRGLYTSGNGMISIEKKMDVIANNLANVNKNAYKTDVITFEAFQDVLTKRINDTRSSSNPSAELGNMSMGITVGEVYTNYKQGNIVNTGRNLDFAINNSESAFFVLMSPDEIQNVRRRTSENLNEKYTRDGAFVLGPEGYLMSKDGNYVMGQDGPIKLEDEDFEINTEGVIKKDGLVIDTLLIKSFSNTQTLRKQGDNTVITTEDTEEEEFKGEVLQGYIEHSNVNTVKEMVEMVNVMRSYEANQKLLQIQDNTLEKAVNLGTVR